uniref:Uncharacterized protein n=1 Tax=Triticum urartu TaxID=4572 RepID=A0A8R7VEU2_TRIUA
MSPRRNRYSSERSFSCPMLCGMAPLNDRLSKICNRAKLVRLPIPAGIVPYRPLLLKVRFFRWGKAEKSNLSSVPFKLASIKWSPVMCPAELQVMCVHLQRLVE